MLYRGNATATLLQQGLLTSWNSTADPMVLSHPECHDSLCPLSKLIAISKDFMVEDWKDECADLYYQYLHGRKKPIFTFV